MDNTLTFLIIGYIASITTTIGYLPQTIKSIKTKNTQGVSIWMFLIITFGSIFWIIYGSLLVARDVNLVYDSSTDKILQLIGDLPLIVADVFVVIMTSTVFFIKLINIRKGIDDPIKLRFKKKQSKKLEI